MKKNKDKHLTYSISKEEVAGAGYRQLLTDLNIPIGNQFTFEELLKRLVLFKFNKNTAMTLDVNSFEDIYIKRFMTVTLHRYQGFREVKTEVYFKPLTKYLGMDTLLEIIEVPNFLSID